VTNVSRLVFFLAVMFCASGCVNRAGATWDSSASAAQMESFYVTKLGPDERGINKLISDKLVSMGLAATTGLGNDIPSGVDILVEYADKWMWDLTMYMVELTITFRDPETEIPLGSGNSLHTSLTRKSPEEMVDEVLANIFKKAKESK
jgi:hypothetical protein